MYALVEPAILSEKRDSSRTLDVDKAYDSKDVAWALPSVVYMHSSPRGGTEVADSPPVLPDVVDSYDIGLETEGEWDVLGISPFGVADVRPNLRTNFIVIHAE